MQPADSEDDVRRWRNAQRQAKSFAIGRVSGRRRVDEVGNLKHPPGREAFADQVILYAMGIGDPGVGPAILSDRVVAAQPCYMHRPRPVPQTCETRRASHIGLHDIRPPVGDSAPDLPDGNQVSHIAHRDRSVFHLFAEFALQLRPRPGNRQYRVAGVGKRGAQAGKKAFGSAGAPAADDVQTPDHSSSVRGKKSPQRPDGGFRGQAGYLAVGACDPYALCPPGAVALRVTRSEDGQGPGSGRGRQVAESGIVADEGRTALEHCACLQQAGIPTQIQARPFQTQRELRPQRPVLAAPDQYIAVDQIRDPISEFAKARRWPYLGWPIGAGRNGEDARAEINTIIDEVLV